MTETTAETEARAETGQDPPPAGRSRAALACWALVAAAALFLAWSCWTFFDMRQGAQQDTARDRDRAVTAARQQLAVLNSMDARHIDQSLQRWQDSSTGALHDELKRTRADSRTKIQKAGTSAVGTVSDAALTALDHRTGSARIIATVQRKRYDAALTRTAAGWKIKSLTALPANAR
jgi:Mce-associated membrane protein